MAMGSKELQRVAIGTVRSSSFCVLSIEEKLGAEVTSGGCMVSTSCVGNEAALLAEHGTLLDIEIAHSTYHR